MVRLVSFRFRQKVASRATRPAVLVVLDRRGGPTGGPAEAFCEGGQVRQRSRRAEAAIMADGSQIHPASLARTRRPRDEKNPTPMGET